MSLVTERIEDNVLYLELNGRIDSSNADQAEELIKAIKEAHPVKLCLNRLFYLF